MKLESLFETEAPKKRWPGAPGREIPLKREYIDWLEANAIPNKDDRYGSEDIGFDSKWFWLDEATGNVCSHPNLWIMFKTKGKIKPPFKFESVGGFSFMSGSIIDDFSWFPKKLDIRLNFFDANVESLKGLSKRVEHVNVFTFPNNICKNLLEVFSIKHVEKVTLNIMIDSPKAKKAKRAYKIIQKHFAGDKDPFDCQDDLIDAGFGDYA